MFSTNTFLPLCVITAFIGIANLSGTETGDSKPKDAYGAPTSVWADIEAKAAKQPPDSKAMDKKMLDMRLAAKAYYEKYKGWTAPKPAPIQPGRLRNLPETPTQPRFPLAGKDWPQNPGDASVCLWEDDKVAAMSFLVWGGMDDQLTAAETLMKKYEGARFTSSLVVGFSEHPALHPGVKLDQAPHAWDAQIHASASGIHFLSQSITWDVDPVFEDGWPGPEWECAESIHIIDTKIPNHKTKMFLQPGAYIAPFNVSKSWRPIVANYFIAQMTLSGGGINPANQTGYFDIKTSDFAGVRPQRHDPTIENDPQPAEDNFYNLLNSDPKTPNYKSYRGWLIANIHMLEADITKPSSVLFGKALEFFAKHRDDLWSGCIDDVAMYGQERDTATVKTTEATNTRITLALTTRMEPTLFDYPLTVKVRLQDGWKSVVARQEGKTIPAQMIQHEKGNFALVKIVPDRGSVVIEQK